MAEDLNMAPKDQLKTNRMGGAGAKDRRKRKKAPFIKRKGQANKLTCP